MYRFRPISSLLDKYHELENQEIYFATPEELNDPMEGFKDVFWKGDRIVWRNFIINYARAVEHFFALLTLLGDTKRIDDDDILVEPNRKVYHTPAHMNLIKQIIDNLFKNDFINKFPEQLEQRLHPIRREELLSYFESIHQFVINAVSDIYYKNGMIPERFLYQKTNELLSVLTKEGNIIDIVNKLESENPTLDAQQFFSITSFISKQYRLLRDYNNSDKPLSSNSFFLVSGFTEKYLSKLETSIHPNWYSASFLSNCSNSALWGHYGDNHRGVCLKYRTTTKENKVEMNLDVVYGSSGGPNGIRELKGMQPQEFRKMNYHNKHVEIDFFRSLARMNRSQLNAFWYSDEKGNSSVCGLHLDNDKNEEVWRNTYWDGFLNSVSVKLSEWEFEQEYRLIINNNFYDYTDKEKRKLKYNFNDLEGIIFGIKTSTSDKIKIMKIVEEKCKINNRKTFDFYQAYYSKDSGKIEKIKLDLIKFE